MEVDGEEVSLDVQILRLCERFPEGMSNAELEARFPGIPALQQAEAINRLLKEDKILLQQIGETLIYKFKVQNPELASKLRGASPQELTTYDVIQEAGNKGIWMRDIRAKCGEIKMQQLNKILKNLEQKKLIKSVKSAEAKRKKMYMLYDLEPDKTVTGGIFYSDGGYDPEVIRVLSENCSKELRIRHESAKKEFPNDLEGQKQRACVSAAFLCEKLNKLGFFKETLAVSDLEQIMETLVYDGVAEKESGGFGKGLMYRACPNTPLPPFALPSIPCTFCPLYNDCTPGGVVSPATCNFLQQWSL